MPKITNKFEDLELNYLDITKDQFNILKMLKHKRALKKEFDTNKIFSCVDPDYINQFLSVCNYARQYKKGEFYNGSFYLRTDLFLNTLIFHSLFKKLKTDYQNDPYFREEYKPYRMLTKILYSADLLGFNTFHSWFNITDLNNYKSKYFCFIFEFLSNENTNINLPYFYRLLGNYQKSSKRYAKAILENYVGIVNELTNLIKTLNWNLDKNFIKQDLFTGLFFRKANTIELYEDEKMQSQKPYIIEVLKANNCLVIDSVFSKNTWNCFKSFTSPQFENRIASVDDDLTNDLNINVDQFTLVPNNQNTYFNFDEITKNLYPISELRSNNNYARQYSNKDFNLLPQGRLPYEKNKDDLFLYGIELEVLRRRTCRRLIIKDIEEKILEGTAIVKMDSSIEGHSGFEIVTVPMSFDYITQSNYFTNFYNQIKNELYSFRSSTTGCHIHVSRKPLNNFDVLKLMKLIMDKTSCELFSLIADRNIEHEHYCKSWLLNWVGDDSRTDQINKYYTNLKRGVSFQRESALNVNNEKTIEFRLFKGNIYPNALTRYLETVKSCIQFVKSNSFKNVNAVNYLDFINNNDTDYPMLHRFIFNHSSKEVYSSGDNVRVKTKAGTQELDREDQLAKDLELISEFKTSYFKKLKGMDMTIKKVRLSKPIKFKKTRRLYQHRTIRRNAN